MKGLNERQRKFVNAYLATGNATEAATVAGYSKKTARAIGAENLTKPYIAEAIAKRQQRHEEKAHITRDEVIAVLAQHVRAALPDYLDETGLVDMDKLRTHNPSALSEITQMTMESGAVAAKIKLHPSVQAATLLAKMLGWNAPEQHNVSVVFRDPEHNGL